MYSRVPAGRFAMSVYVLVTAVGLAMPSQCHLPESSLTYRSSPLAPTAVMIGSASLSLVSSQRAEMDDASVTNRTAMPAELRERFQTAGRTSFSAFAGKRSYGALVSDQPWPSMASARAS